MSKTNSKIQKNSDSHTSTTHSTAEHNHTHSHGGHEGHKALYTNLKVDKLPHSEVEINAEIPAEALEKAYTSTVAAASKSVEIPGFRKGKAPEKSVVSHIGEMRLLEEAADDLISHEYQHIVIDNHIEVIAHPEITVTRLARGNAIAFKARVAVFPTFTLEGSKEIAKAALKDAKAAQEVTEEDIEKVLKEIVTIHTREKKKKENKDSKDSKDSKDNTSSEKNGGDAEEKIPELTDELARELGPFKDLTELRAKVKENLGNERAHKAKEQRRLKIGDALIAAAKIDVPPVLVESEIDRMWKEFEYDLSQMGLGMKDYLARINKTEATVRSEWHDKAYKKVCLQLILNRISIDEKINPEEKILNEQIAAVKEQYPDVSEDRIRAHVEMVLTNEAVFKVLEGEAADRK